MSVVPQALMQVIEKHNRDLGAQMAVRGKGAFFIQAALRLQLVLYRINSLEFKVLFPLLLL